MRKFDLSLRSSRSSYFATFRHQLTILSKLTRWMRRSGLICLSRSSKTGLDMSHILFIVVLLSLTFSLFPYTTLFRSLAIHLVERRCADKQVPPRDELTCDQRFVLLLVVLRRLVDRKSTRLNSSHQIKSYAVFCLKKNK